MNNAGVVDDSTILDSVRIDRRTAHAYWQLLERLFMVEAVPAWWFNRLPGWCRSRSGIWWTPR